VIVERIFICPERGATQVECERIKVVQGMGVFGDRNYGISKHPGQNLTLVEAEEIESFYSNQGRVPDLSKTRRNLITRGVRLNNLVDVEFIVGGVRMRGVELCEPCTILGTALSCDSSPVAAVIKQWVGRGGLRVDVLSSGEILRGAKIETCA
jgi:MOSC domain-containing protein YiiM